jgi:squalene synthase HpnC
VGWDFAVELARYGPASPGTEMPGLAASRAYCARVARSHYENFVVASVLLPRKLVPHFHAVYAYCRWADDLADETAGGQASLDLLAWWRGELQRCYAGTPRHPVMVALRETIRRFDIPARPFLDLLTAFEQDQRVKRYATFDQLLGYCRNSANPVGRLVLHLFECHDDERGRLADDVCTGLQLANFWQDVARDFDESRIYLPLDDLARFGVSEDDLAAKRFTPAFAELLRFQVERTRTFLSRGRELLPRLPGRVRTDVALFAAGGHAILDAIERQRYDVLSRRPTVGKLRQVWLLAKAAGANLLSRFTAPPRSAQSPAPGTVDSATLPPARASHGPPG